MSTPVVHLSGLTHEDVLDDMAMGGRGYREWTLPPLEGGVAVIEAKYATLCSDDIRGGSAGTLVTFEERLVTCDECRVIGIRRASLRLQGALHAPEP